VTIGILRLAHLPVPRLCFPAYPVRRGLESREGENKCCPQISSRNQLAFEDTTNKSDYRTGHLMVIHVVVSTKCKSLRMNSRSLMDGIQLAGHTVSELNFV
jgi:hypothetical protein